MIRHVTKLDGRTVWFDISKINSAVTKASKKLMESGEMTLKDLSQLIQSLAAQFENYNKSDITVQDIQRITLKTISDLGFTKLYMEYDAYRRERNRIRDIKSDLMATVRSIGVETDRDNANVGGNFSAKLLRIASETNKWQNLALIPKNLAKLHEQGDLYYHDLDSYNLTINCLHLDTASILESGFNPGYGLIRKPKRIESAAEISCIMLQSSQNDMFGGQSHVDFDNALAPYVTLTRDEIVRDITDMLGSNTIMHQDEFNSKVNTRLLSRVSQAMQNIVYNLNTMHSRAGSQVPFSSVNIGLPDSPEAALVCELFLKEYEKGLGNNEQPIFPNIIFRCKKGVNFHKEDPYYYLYKLACRVAAKRLNPTFMNVDADFNLYLYNKGIKPAIMGCRTYIAKNVNGPEGPNRRGNIAPVSVNLPRIALEVKGNIEEFFEVLRKKLELATDSLMHRKEVLCRLTGKDLPLVCGQKFIMGSENVGPSDSIEPILVNGTWAIGFIGLAEALVALTGKHHGECDYSRKLGEEIVSFIRNFTDEKTQQLGLNFGCYATPAEGLSGKFIQNDKKLFGVIRGVTDKDYYTNSFHIPVGYNIPYNKKIEIEAPYHNLCNSGHISYVELDGYPTGDIIDKIITNSFNNTNIGYVGINFHLKYCKNCGATIEENISICECGSDDIQGISRVTGYLSLDERFGEGKVAERADRISHTNFKKNYIL